jgi:hypothetical protein
MLRNFAYRLLGKFIGKNLQHSGSTSRYCCYPLRQCKLLLHTVTWIVPHRIPIDSGYNNCAEKAVSFCQIAIDFCSIGGEAVLGPGNTVPLLECSIKIPILPSLYHTFYRSFSSLVMTAPQNRTFFTFHYFFFSNHDCYFGII